MTGRQEQRRRGRADHVEPEAGDLYAGEGLRVRVDCGKSRSQADHVHTARPSAQAGRADATRYTLAGCRAGLTAPYRNSRG
jgi:hypothetical protein